MLKLWGIKAVFPEVKQKRNMKYLVKWFKIKDMIYVIDIND